MPHANSLKATPHHVPCFVEEEPEGQDYLDVANLQLAQQMQRFFPNVAVNPLQSMACGYDLVHMPNRNHARCLRVDVPFGSTQLVTQ